MSEQLWPAPVATEPVQATVAIPGSKSITNRALILAALPTAQNVYNYAATYRKDEIVARDTVFLSTFLALPVMLGIAALFGG